MALRRGSQNVFVFVFVIVIVFVIVFVIVLVSVFVFVIVLEGNISGTLCTLETVNLAFS